MSLYTNHTDLYPQKQVPDSVCIYPSHMAFKCIHQSLDCDLLNPNLQILYKHFVSITNKSTRPVHDDFNFHHVLINADGPYFVDVINCFEYGLYDWDLIIF